MREEFTSKEELQLKAAVINALQNLRDFYTGLYIAGNKGDSAKNTEKEDNILDYLDEMSEVSSHILETVFCE